VDDVTDGTFDEEVLASPVPVIVDFWARWCRPCDAIEPHLRGIAAEHEGRVRLVRVDVDANLGAAGRYGVLSLPTVVLFAEGKPQATVHGAQARRAYERAFAPFLGAQPAA
jgi:thioredoxin 1